MLASWDSTWTNLPFTADENKNWSTAFEVDVILQITLFGIIREFEKKIVFFSRYCMKMIGKFIYCFSPLKTFDCLGDWNDRSVAWYIFLWLFCRRRDHHRSVAHDVSSFAARGLWMLLATLRTTLLNRQLAHETFFQTWFWSNLKTFVNCDALSFYSWFWGIWSKLIMRYQCKLIDKNHDSWHRNNFTRNIKIDHVLL